MCQKTSKLRRADDPSDVDPDGGDVQFVINCCVGNSKNGCGGFPPRSPADLIWGRDPINLGNRL